MPDDTSGVLLDGSKASYTLQFPEGKLPRAKFFWSITMYSVSQRLQVENPIDRYSIGSSTPGLKPNADGSLTIYVSTKWPARTTKTTHRGAERSLLDGSALLRPRAEYQQRQLPKTALHPRR